MKAYIAKHGEILKKFIDVENFFENLKQSRSMVHYKLSLLQIFKKLLKTILNLKTQRYPQLILEITLSSLNQFVNNIQFCFHSWIIKPNKKH